MPNEPQEQSQIVATGAAPAPYFPRRLRRLTEPDREAIADSELVSIARPIVILGEPGMGKSEMLRELGQVVGIPVIPASRFMNSQNPRAITDRGQPVLIDALDEAIARSEGDAVDKVLARLEEAGCPRFILSCRAREWQSRAGSDLKAIYGSEPLILSIEQFTREEARSFWATRGFVGDAGPVLDRMDEQGLGDLYKNPLTLTLLGRVADSGRSLPATRAGLFEHVCELSWTEPDESRQNSALAKLSQAQALSAAGAAMAALIFSGAEAISSFGIGAALEEDVPITEIEVMPGAGSVRVVLGSKLFKSVSVGRFAPIHRVVAEFLGAKWLAEQSTNSRSRRRLLALFQGSGVVPSSLRGLHAWLAFHSPLLAPSVIASDPFGLLRYGESSILDTAQAMALFDALDALAIDDPYFRSQDWDARTALGLAQPALAEKIEVAIEDSKRSPHLRSLLLESIKGSPIVERFSTALERILYAATCVYAERDTAADILLPLHDRERWRMAIFKLLNERSENSIRLALRLSKELQYDLPDGLLAKLLLADLGFFDSPVQKTTNRPPFRVHQFDRLVSALSPVRAKSILRLVTASVSRSKLDPNGDRHDYSDLAALLLLRALRGGAIRTKDAPMLWTWLSAAENRSGYGKSHYPALTDEMRARDALRHATQRYGIWKAKRSKRLYVVEHYLRERGISIATNPSDAAFFLYEIRNRPSSRRQRNDWLDLVDLGIRLGSTNREVVEAALAQPHLMNQQRAHLRGVQRPRKLRWQIEEKANTVKRAVKLEAHRESLSRQYESALAKVRCGDLAAVIFPAEVFLGRRALDAADLEKRHEDRLAVTFNKRLVKEFMAGFEATLHRSDLPTLQDHASSYLQGKYFNYAFPLVAGLLARAMTGSGFSGVPMHVLRSGLLLCMQRRFLFGGDEDLAVLRTELEVAAAPTPEDKCQLARAWIEPLLDGKYSAEQDIRFLAGQPGWEEVGGSLAREWLSRFPDIPLATEMELVSLLDSADTEDQILDAVRERDSGIYRNEEQALAWLAIDIRYRFNEVRDQLKGVGFQNPEFIWTLRDRMQTRRRGSLLDVSAAAAKWIVSEFRRPFPYARLEGAGSGSTNSYDATDFLRSLLVRIAEDTCDEAVALLRELADEPRDLYTDEILHMAAEQRRKRSEEKFAPIEPGMLAKVLANGQPVNIDDLRSLVVEELSEVQLRLLGDELDPVNLFWSDEGIPYGENICRDRLIGMVEMRLADSYGVKKMTETDMPKDKRADVGFSVGATLQLPMEVKGQWHADVWDAASSQLDAKYLIDWRSLQRGIYCVFWFGNLRAVTNRRLSKHPDGLPAPKSAEQMRAMLIDRIPPERRSVIDVVVIDMATGKK